MSNIFIGDSLSVLKTIKADTVDCCVTSPPYYGLRDYGVDGQIGLETTPQEYVNKLVKVFHEVKRVLRSDGTLWIVIADSYSGSGKGRKKDGNPSHFSKKQMSNGGTIKGRLLKTIDRQCKPKNLIGIPWLLAFALRDDGWYIRDDIIWAKPNPMPESVRDRCTKSYEHIFMLTKSPRYYFDGEAIAEPVAKSTIPRLQQKIEMQTGSTRVQSKSNGNMKACAPRFDCLRRNKRNVWIVTTKPFKGAHFATFPPDLIEPCILAGCRKGGVVLDPFIGSGTTAVVAQKTGREYIGIELNPDYVEIAYQRLQKNNGQN